MGQWLLLLPVGGEGTDLGLKFLKVSAKQGSWMPAPPRAPPHLGKMLSNCNFFPRWRRQTLPRGGGGGGVGRFRNKLLKVCGETNQGTPNKT